MDLDRRQMFAAMAAFASLGGVLAPAQEVPATPGTAADTVPMGTSKVFRFAEMPVTQNANGGWGRQVMHGTLPTGEFVEVHETMLPVGKMPHPPHRHRNTEFLLIRQGTLEYLNDGVPEPAGVGDVVFTASNVMHGLKNVGTTPALYFVVSISHGQL